MGRWQPDARGRLERAAFELFELHGFEQTTVAAIAERAGVTSRTFFRHFGDKREVLFWGGGMLQAFLVGRVADSGPDLTPLESVLGAFRDAGDEIFEDRREYARRRRAIIAANPELQEREIAKLAAMATAIVDALRLRGVDRPTASLASQVGLATFRVAFEGWATTDDRALSEAIAATAAALRPLVTATGAA